MRILLIVYDNDSFLHWFPQGIAYIASSLRAKKHEVEIYNQDIYHFKDEHLTYFLDNNPKYDVVGIGVIAGYYQYRKLLSLSKAVNASKNRPDYYILGGHGPSPEPEYFLRKAHADIAIIGEGEETVAELCDVLEHKGSLSQVKGVAYLNSGRVIVNPRRELIEDIDSIGWPAYDMFPIEVYRMFRFPHATSRDFVMPILSGRGCQYKCNFCYRMDRGLRIRSPDSIIDEIEYLKKKYQISYIIFSDELLMSSEERTVKLCDKLIRSKLDVKWWCNGRLNYAKKNVLAHMKKAGCVFINYGIESYDDDILKMMNKRLTVKEIEAGIVATLDSGISPGFNIIFGNIGEDSDILEKGVEFLLKYDDLSEMRTIRPVTPYPGSPLYYHAIDQGLLKGVEDFYEHKHTNSDLLTVNFTKLTDDEFYRALWNANHRLLENYYMKKSRSSTKLLDDLYIRNNASFRGFRHT